MTSGKVSLSIPSREDSGNPIHPHCQSTLPCPGRWRWKPGTQDKLPLLRLHFVRHCLPLGGLGGCITQPRVCLCSVPGSHTRCRRDSWAGAKRCTPAGPAPALREVDSATPRRLHPKELTATRLWDVKCPESRHSEKSLFDSHYAGSGVQGRVKTGLV